MRLIVGLDQGSTKTNAAVCDTYGNIVACGSAPGSLHTQLGMEDALLRMRQAAEMALSSANAGWRDVICLSGGLTGIDYPYEQALLTGALKDEFGISDVFVHNDCIGALWGGTFEAPAVVCCAGTGLNLGGVNLEGEILQLGNYANGNYQGAGAIGQAALQAVFDAHILKSRSTALSDMILRATGAKDIDELLLMRYRKDAVDVPALCPLVFDAAGRKDAVARDILSEFGDNWAGFILSVMKLLKMKSDEKARIVLSGSVFKGEPGIPKRRIEAILAKEAPNAYAVQARYEPVVGGCVMGLFYKGEGHWQKNIEHSAVALKLLRREDEAE